MTKDEAIKAMANGARIKHHNFSSNEWMEQQGAVYLLEDGNTCTPDGFWATRSGESWEYGWMEIKTKSDRVDSGALAEKMLEEATGGRYARNEPYVNHDKIGRNSACPCGSGKKWKKCHLLIQSNADNLSFKQFH